MGERSAQVPLIIGVRLYLRSLRMRSSEQPLWIVATGVCIGRAYVQGAIISNDVSDDDDQNG
jgi:hypothetical protein